jgi:hypothetical protein
VLAFALRICPFTTLAQHLPEPESVEVALHVEIADEHAEPSYEDPSIERSALKISRHGDLGCPQLLFAGVDKLQLVKITTNAVRARSLGDLESITWS